MSFLTSGGETLLSRLGETWVGYRFQPFSLSTFKGAINGMRKSMLSMKGFSTEGRKALGV